MHRYIATHIICTCFNYASTDSHNTQYMCCTCTCINSDTRVLYMYMYMYNIDLYMCILKEVDSKTDV